MKAVKFKNEILNASGSSIFHITAGLFTWNAFKVVYLVQFDCDFQKQ